MRGSGWMQGFGWAAIAWLGVGCGGEVEREGSPDPVTSSIDAGDDALRPDTDASIPTATRADASIPDASARGASIPDAAIRDADAADASNETTVPAPDAAPASPPDASSPPARDAGPPPPPPPPPPPACAEPSVPSLPAWKPPTALHQGACTATQIATYTDCVGTAGCTSTSTSCDACLQTDASAAAYGPIILGTGASDGFGEAFVNWGGCQSRLDGHTAAGSCGSETNAWQACANEICPYATCAGGALEVCEDYAYETACAGHTESDACAAEWSRPGTGVPQCANLVTLATLWCGM